MFRNAHFDRVEQMFADQFEPDGTGYLYRRSLRGAPIRVTAAERDAFIAQFAKSQRRLSLIIVAIILIGIAVLVTVVPTFGEREHDPLPFVVVGIAVVTFLIPWRLAWNAPARVLERRAVVGIERTRGEAGRAMIERMSWRQFLAITVGAGFAWWSFAPDNGAWIGWRVMWALAGMALFGGMAWRAWQKISAGSPDG